MCACMICITYIRIFTRFFDMLVVNYRCIVTVLYGSKLSILVTDIKSLTIQNDHISQNTCSVLREHPFDFYGRGEKIF